MQLGNAGYEIWSDVIKLIGGELFWDDIEDAIRNHSAKVVVAVSKSAIGKAGVLDEIAVAIGVERSQKIANFVVPLRLDDIDFNDFRANLTRKNVIDFSGGWTLSVVRDDVCYIGLVFKKMDANADGKNACCGAQMFLGSGDGVVFKGVVGPWYSPTTTEFHISEAKAREVAAMVVGAYKAKHGRPPKELFIHAKHRFSDEEWRGFSSAVGPDTKLVGVRIQSSKDIKLFRLGKSPVLRGAAYRYTTRIGYLWTLGFIPSLQTYPGREAPNPLMVEVTRGDADLLQVMNDVLALTKLNFNACIYGDGLPVTLRFADDVGEILTAAPLEDLPPLPFKHYI